jgi:hypothetical protein
MPPLAIGDLDDLAHRVFTDLGNAISPLPEPHAYLATSRATDDDDLIADLLISMWALASGRFLRRGVRPEQLSKEELIDFWADDLAPVLGRTAAPHDPQLPNGPAPSKGTLRARPH